MDTTKDYPANPLSIHQMANKAQAEEAQFLQAVDTIRAILEMGIPRDLIEKAIEQGLITALSHTLQWGSVDSLKFTLARAKNQYTALGTVEDNLKDWGIIK